MDLPTSAAHLESRIGPREVTGLEPEDYDDYSAVALHRLAENQGKGPHVRDWETTQTVALTAGVGALPTAMLPGYVRRVTCTNLPDPLQPRDSQSDFNWSYCQEVGQYTIDSQNIVIQGTPDVPTVNITSISVTGVTIPTLLQLLTKYEDEYVDELVKVAYERMGRRGAQVDAEGQGAMA